MNSRPTIVVLIHDGFYSCGTGAARSNRAFLEVLTAQLHPDVRLIVMPIHLIPASTEYNPAWHKELESLVHQAGGNVIPVDNGTGGQVRFGGLEAFENACAKGAETINQKILPVSGPLLIIAFDCPFYGLARHLDPRARSEVVIVARSTAALHVPDDRARISWELAGLHHAVKAGGRIAAISGHMRTHLADSYQIPDRALLDLPNGLPPSDWRHIPPPDARLLPSRAQRGFILSMGRAVPYKAFDDLLDALSLLARQSVAVPHTVLAAVTEDHQLSPYQAHLAQRIATESLDATLLTHFAPDLRSLLAHPALDAVVVPSRVEPFGRIPLEAFVAGAPVVATAAGGLAELVTDQTGYRARPGDPASLAAAISRALAADPAERARLRAAGRHLASTRYDYPRTMRGFLNHAAPWAITPAGPSVASPISRAQDDPSARNSMGCWASRPRPLN
ncbi:glycosyltransferase family 4 protein [Actinomadura barringtoniae]|uniref:Glycosyltransferase family 4 protein n=1 Tax=Actinomadura barringtoniae TaxID=1427535 RepID=A0A939P7H0_9ACTN|nr:glycosyltransferase family 4 protein [Actinomadura barringtoniae]MBO2447116.1 glycosyltransferase family 4 protein [Actinomadura barringtoniae]